MFPVDEKLSRTWRPRRRPNLPLPHPRQPAPAPALQLLPANHKPPRPSTFKTPFFGSSREEASAHQPNQWGLSAQSASTSLNQPQQQPSHLNQSLYGKVFDLATVASVIAGSYPQEYVRILNTLFTANGLPTYTVPDEVFTTSTSATGSSPAPDPVSDIVNVAAPTSAATPAPATEATQKPTPSHPSPSATSTEPSTPATRPAAVIQLSRTQPPRSTTSAFDSSYSSDEEVSVGTSSPPSRRCQYSAADFLHDTTLSTSNDSTTMTTRGQTTKPTDKPKKKTNDPSLLKSSRKNKDHRRHTVTPTPIINL
ncbi:mucin-7-like [Procambarus clarkii]|uniref:mucin-7-like n=1 Tax=Procambarus clarkii TaxID=6728 RepID=UPI0037433F5D